MSKIPHEMSKHPNTIKLGQLASIRTGHAFRGKVKHTPSAWNYYVLQLGDVQKDCHINLDQAARVDMTSEKPPQSLQPGDILLRARGGYYYSGLFSGEAPNVIASGQFLVLTPNTQMADPAYVCWYLNQPPSQQYFERNDTGTNIPMINKRTLSDLPVPLPALQTQHKIATIHQTWLREKALTERLLHNREQMVRGVCQAFIDRELLTRDAT